MGFTLTQYLKVQSKGGREGRTRKTQKSLLYTVTYIKEKALPSINSRRLGPIDSCCCTFISHYLQEAMDPICFSTHVRCKPVLYYCLLRSCKMSGMGEGIERGLNCRRQKGFINTKNEINNKNYPVGENRLAGQDRTGLHTG